MKFVWIILFSFLSADLYSQVYESADDIDIKWKSTPLFSGMKSDFDISLNIMNDNLYFMSFTIYHHDMVHTTFISYGDIQIVRNMYYLTDISCGFKLVLEKQKQGDFLVKRGFYFLKNKILKLNDAYGVDTVGFSVSSITRECRHVKNVKKFIPKIKRMNLSLFN